MKKLILIALSLSITSCGPSTDELEALAKKNTDIAKVTCNIISESPTYDAAMRIKEVNLGREKIGEDLFLGKDNEIAESLFYGLCEELVLNDTEYSNKLNEQILIAEQLRLKEEQEAEQLRLIAEQEAEQLRIEQEEDDKKFMLYLLNERNQTKKLELENILEYKLSNQEWTQIIKDELYDLNIKFDNDVWVEINVDGQSLKAELFSKGDSLNLQIFKPFTIKVGDSFAVQGTYQGNNIDFITGSDRLNVNTIYLYPEHNVTKQNFFSKSDFDLFVLRVHILSSYETAKTLSDVIKEAGYPSFIEPFETNKDLYAIYVGPFLSKDEIKDNLKDILRISQSSQSEIIRLEL